MPLDSLVAISESGCILGANERLAPSQNSLPRQGALAPIPVLLPLLLLYL
jgi:hypothetical protein